MCLDSIESAAETVHDYDNERLFHGSQEMLDDLRKVWTTPLTLEDLERQSALSISKGQPVFLLRRGMNIAQVNLSTLRSIMNNLSRHIAAEEWSFLAIDIEKYQGFILESGDGLAVRQLAEFKNILNAQC
ncbi:hypothetical protein CRT60_06555 [Azospirillum palustre]|uniref:Uncharacterized protein n=1 Tax=Azospirillum palustre TaxID=2044885 RepID=A0A2B8BIU8_9PROT|nr:hypothetical protein [Azospirillum palustre]PGH57649.1 hypothetical protein CRT60_06555 [Azospirillum palustre]